MRTKGEKEDVPSRSNGSLRLIHVWRAVSMGPDCAVVAKVGGEKERERERACAKKREKDFLSV